MSDELPQLMRSDARENGDRILRAAREVFATDGLGAPMREIARRARVGPATLYRHFPTKEMLATEAFRGEMTACYAIVDEGLADPDPWHGFRHVIERLFELHARNRGFTEAFMSTYPYAMDFAASRRRAMESLSGLARRAIAAGQLRPDFVLDDFVLMLMANDGIRAASADERTAASRRFAALAIQSFAASVGNAPLPPAAKLSAHLESIRPSGSVSDARSATAASHIGASASSAPRR